jgi:hypothetical protein
MVSQSGERSAVEAVPTKEEIGCKDVDVLRRRTLLDLRKTKSVISGVVVYESGGRALTK